MLFEPLLHLLRLLLLIPPLYDDTNYAYWKVCMIAFLQSLDEKVWLAIEVFWKQPEEPPTTWDDAKIKAANFNSTECSIYLVL